ncbi:Mss4-like protein [Gloeophyllum trabeum ATCC 11539]|uniref:Mss4-like protein n=1 Tax=Gloeophyllum trabeum (strain ATCC 11539 / FP-39264 / Madison 617) TaxID=670483 RepID=S7PVP6_GLOTA|nr:Mss4-like protein [Gloeophyllum trabeum ATCC 11539]EPQ51578.1 Mss4-like protein [Gloeophyllum trabeum ATCC 11539]
MRKLLPSPSAAPTAPQSQVPAGLWEALQASSSRPRPASQLLPSFPNGLADVLSPETNTNKPDLLCPRPGCGSLILKSGAATLQERSSILLEPPEYQSRSPLAPLPPPGTPAHWWLVTPSPMAFENIGFSKPLTDNPRMKLLACAECDLGPLGWCEQGGREFWLAVGRVGYRV